MEEEKNALKKCTDISVEEAFFFFKTSYCQHIWKWFKNDKGKSYNFIIEHYNIHITQNFPNVKVFQ